MSDDAEARSGQVGPEIARYLPLSQRPRRDESGVSHDWSGAVARTVGLLAGAVAAASTAEMDGPSLRPGWSNLEVAAWVGWRLGTTRTNRLQSTLRGVFSQRSMPSETNLRIARREAKSGREAVLSSLQRLTEHGDTVPVHRSQSDLSSAVVATIDVASALGAPLSLDPIATGAVALARSLSGPIAIRAVLADHTFVATDADWRVGAGTSTYSKAIPILLFLFGRAGVPGSDSPTLPVADSA